MPGELWLARRSRHLVLLLQLLLLMDRLRGEGAAVASLVAKSADTGTSTAATVRSYENDTVLLPCHLEDLGLQTRVRWWRDGVLLADSDQPVAIGNQSSSQRVKMWGNRSLELLQVRPEDSGAYVCQATRPEPWGQVTQVHEIQVMYPASVKPVPPSGQLEVSLDEEVTMSCLASGVPKPTIAWSFQGEELPVLAAGQKLRVHATNRSLAGLYECQASNGIGEPARASIELKIKHKPEVSATSRWQHSAPGIRARLECLVVAWPEATLDWYFEGARIEHTGLRAFRYKLDEPAAAATASASGAGVSNAHGSTATATGTAGSGSASSTGGRPGTSAQLHRLVIRSVEDGNLGRYACRATNELGSAEASMELSGLPRPAHLKKEARSSSSSSYNFIWEVDSYSPIVEYQFWFRQLDSREDWRRLFIPSGNEAAGPLHARSFNLTGLVPSRQYEALVLARNRFGWSSPSKIVRFSTSPAPLAEKEAYEIDGSDHESIPSAVQVSSNSDRSAADADSGGSSAYVADRLTTTLLLLLPALVIAPAAARTVLPD